MSTVNLDDDSDYRSEDASTPASDEESAIGATKRKLEVSLTRTSISARGSRAEMIIWQGDSFGVGDKKKSEDVI